MYCTKIIPRYNSIHTQSCIECRYSFLVLVIELVFLELGAVYVYNNGTDHDNANIIDHSCFFL